MRAAQVEQYNKNNISVKMVDLGIPVIGEREVLIKVLAAGVNPLDNYLHWQVMSLWVQLKKSVQGHQNLK